MTEKNANLKGLVNGLEDWVRTEYGVEWLDKKEQEGYTKKDAEVVMTFAKANETSQLELLYRDVKIQFDELRDLREENEKKDVEIVKLRLELNRVYKDNKRLKEENDDCNKRNRILSDRCEKLYVEKKEYLRQIDKMKRQLTKIWGAGR